MKRTMSNETRATRAIKMIYNAMATWEDVAEVLKISVSHCRKIVREHYKSKTAYNKLLAKARENARLKKEADKLISVEVDADEVKTDEAEVDTEVKADDESKTEERKQVVLVETGYMLDVGLPEILNESLDVFMPSFNLKELEKLTRSVQVAEEILTLYYSTYRITPVQLKEEELFSKPVELVKPRTVGVVAAACHLWANNYRVVLKTNSKEVERLAKQQGIDIDVVLIHKKPQLLNRLA
jgi:hypothetical protein